MNASLRHAFLPAVALCAVSASAIDHNNLEKGRPLRFDDAYSIAYLERAFETGISLDSFRNSGPTFGLESEFKYGFAKNQDIGIAFDPAYMSSSSSGDWGDVTVGYMHGLRREIGNDPALGYRLDVSLPLESGRAVRTRLRGIATRALGQYDKLHLNVDMATTLGGPSSQDVRFGAILGYSTPLGYPRSFNSTLVAELSVQQVDAPSKGFATSIGLGLRRQVGVRSVIDFGVQADLSTSRGEPGAGLKLVAGYSIGF